jgi:hypothetical protein
VNPVAASEVTPPSRIVLELPSTLTLGAPPARPGVSVQDASGATLPDIVNEITWTSSNPEVATVNAADGSVEATGAGTTTITARLGTVVQSASVTVEVPVTAVSVVGGDRSLEVGETVGLGARVSGPGGVEVAGQTLRWSSSASSVASVDSQGRVSALEPGQTTVRVEAAGELASVVITVLAPAPTLPSEADLRRLIDSYTAALNAGEQDTVRQLWGSGDANALGDLLDIMERPRFQASIAEIGDVTAAGDGAASSFTLTLRYGRSFGGDREESYRFSVRMSEAGDAWQFSTVSAVPN